MLCFATKFKSNLENQIIGEKKWIRRENDKMKLDTKGQYGLLNVFTFLVNSSFFIAIGLNSAWPVKRA